MSIHRFLFPNCNDRELERANARIAELEAVSKSLTGDLKREVSRNRKREDELINRVLTKNGQFAIPSREAEVKEPEAVKPPAQDDAREAQIDARTLELEETYRQRGRSIPRPVIREMVEKNYEYLMDDDRVEIG
jgi:hypothetical protein